MQKHLVRTPEDALLYLTDCHLATVSDLAMKRSRGKHEFERHIQIAQTSVDWIKSFRIEIPVHSRAYDVLSLPDQKVSSWVEKYLRD